MFKSLRNRASVRVTAILLAVVGIGFVSAAPDIPWIHNSGLVGLLPFVG
jgi:hypothetical protein